MYRPVSIAVVLLFSATFLVAQRSVPGGGKCSVKVFVSYSDTGQPAAQMMVRLLDGTGADINLGSTEGNGQILFVDLRPGTYSVKISGPGVEDAGSRFEIAIANSTHVEMVRVKRTSPVTPGLNKVTTVPAADLRIPGDAQKEAERAYAALNRNDFKEARKRFQKAADIYPQFASAYHGLGVAEMRSGDSQAARAAFEKSISLNDRYTAAYLDLSRLSYAENKYSEAEVLLDKAIIAEPANPEVLTMLARVELLDGKPDEAIANAHKVHDMPAHEKYAIVHFVAGKAYESKGDRQQAAAEYQEFLKEAPGASNADRVRATLQALQKR